MIRIIILVISSSVISISLLAQEKSHTKPDFYIIGRLDSNVEFSHETSAFEWGNSGLYTQLSGPIGDHLHYLILNHWVSSGTKELYDNIGRSDSPNFLDFAFVKYSNHGLSVEFGKDLIPFGTIEQDGDDYSAHPFMSSVFWNTACLYQWGTQVSYSLPSEKTSFTIGIAASPFGEHPFKNGMMSYSIQWRGHYDLFASIWSINLLEMPGKRFLSMLAFGNQLTIGNFSVAVDFVNTAALDVAGFFKQEMTLVGFLDYQLCDKVELQAKLGRERNNCADSFFLDGLFMAQPYWFWGTAVNYYPLKENRDFRLHLGVAWKNNLKGMIASLGVLYSMNLSTL